MTRELAAHFPHEMCILHRMIILIFGVPTCLLVTHNALLLRQLWPAHPLLCAWCGLRVSLCVVRPYLWRHVLREYGAARRQPTPALVAQAFIAAQDERLVRLNARLGVCFICWLCGCSAYLAISGLRAGGRSEAEEALWAHCKLNFWSLVIQVRARRARAPARSDRAARRPPARSRFPSSPLCPLQKILSICIFFFLISSERVSRSLLPETLEAYTTVTRLSEADVAAAGSASLAAAAASPRAPPVLTSSECIICSTEFEAGEQVRWLACAHAFHRGCIDEWALRHKNRCPLCQRSIGPPEPSLEQLLGRQGNPQLLGRQGLHPHAD